MVKISWLIFTIQGYTLVPIDYLSGHPAVRGCVSDLSSLRSLCSLRLEKSVVICVSRGAGPVSKNQQSAERCEMGIEDEFPNESIEKKVPTCVRFFLIFIFSLNLTY